MVSQPINRKKAFNMLFFLEFWERFGYYGLQAVLASFFVRSLGMADAVQCHGLRLCLDRRLPRR